MTNLRISQLPAATLTNFADYAPISQNVTTPGTGITRKATFAQAAQGIGLGYNVLAFGATGDGTGNDTAAIQLALNTVPAEGGTVILPKGFIFTFNAPLSVKSKTIITGGGVLKALPKAQWAGTPYRGLYNENKDALVITDEDITIRGIAIDYSDFGDDLNGTEHCIRMRMVRRVVVENCYIVKGASSVAFLACDDSQEIGNSYINFANCGSDHWDNPQNARLVDCYIRSTNSAQMVNFNPEPTSSVTTGHVADGFVMIGCTVISDEAAAAPCQIEPLATGNTVKNVTVTGNVFKNSYLVMRGDVQGLTVTGNTLADFRGTTAALYVRERFGVQASGAILTGNTILNPLTAAPAEAVIVAQSDSAIVAGNVILGSGYSTSAISMLGTEGQLFGNYTESSPVGGRLQGGARVINGSNSYWGWTDTSGTHPRMLLQTDNNWRWLSTDAAGADRSVASIQARSDTSELRWSVPMLFNGSYTRRTPMLVAAAGTTIGSATPLTADLNAVTSATLGVAEGVSLFPVDGQVQVIVNLTAITIYVYPNNSGSSQIDNGGVDVPVTIAPGKSKSFTRTVPGEFYTIAVT